MWVDVDRSNPWSLLLATRSIRTYMKRLQCSLGYSACRCKPIDLFVSNDGERAKHADAREFAIQSVCMEHGERERVEEGEGEREREEGGKL